MAGDLRKLSAISRQWKKGKDLFSATHSVYIELIPGFSHGKKQDLTPHSPGIAVQSF